MVRKYLPSTNMFISRHIIAAVHFNNNLHRDDKTNKDGSQQIKVVYPKFKNGAASVRNVKVKPNYGMKKNNLRTLPRDFLILKDDFVFIRLC